MEFFNQLFRNKEKKTVLNFVTMLFIGIVLIIVGNTILKKPSGEEVKTSSNNNIKTSEKQIDFASKLEKKLELLLSNVEGVGNAKVMLTLENQGEIIVAEDSSIDKSSSVETIKGNSNETNAEKRNTNSSKQENKKVLLENSKPLVLKEIQPKIKGVLVIAQGGGNAKVKNSIIKAIQALLNVDVNKIEVLKMK